MATSSLSKPRTQYRNRRFFDRYDYCLAGTLKEAFVLRYRQHDMIEKIIENRRAWGQRMAAQPGSWVWALRVDVTDQDIENLHGALTIIENLGPDIKFTVCSNSINFYVNSQDHVNTLSGIPGLHKTVVTQVKLRGAPDAINLQNPQHQNRSYFRYQEMTTEQKANLVNFLASQTDIRVSPGLKFWLGHPHRHRLLDYYFIDHDDLGIITMLALILGQSIRKTIPIRAY